jgi:hypothetical protein
MTDIKQMINETELTILGRRDVLERFAKKYPQEQLDRNRQRIEAHWLGQGSLVSVTIIKTREAA